MTKKGRGAARRPEGIQDPAARHGQFSPKIFHDLLTTASVTAFELEEQRFIGPFGDVLDV